MSYPNHKDYAYYLEHGNDIQKLNVASYFVNGVEDYVQTVAFVASLNEVQRKNLLYWMKQTDTYKRKMIC